jgi:Na+/melibiose symporter and related transporters
MGNTNLADKPKKNLVGGFEKLAYCNFFVGQNMVFMVITNFITIYFANTLGIDMKITGLILLLARIWDALVDPVLASVIEKSHFKLGKFKPWVRLASVTVPLFTWLCFGFQDYLLDQTMGFRIAFVTIIYVLWGTIYAASDAPAYAMATAITPVQEERNFLLSYNTLFGLVGILVAMIGFPLINAAFGTKIDENTINYNWTASVGIFMLIAMVFMLFIFVCKERVSHEGQKVPTTAEIFKAVIHNKYLLLVVIVMLVANGLNFVQGLAAFLAKDIYGDPNSVMLIMVAQMLPMIVVAPLTPMLIKKFGKIKLMNFSFISIAVFSVLIALFARSNIGIYAILSVIKGLLSGPFMIAFSILFADCVEYYAYKTGERHEAITFAARTFVSKLISAFSGGLGVIIIGFFGYKSATADEVVVQSATALNGLWWVTNLGPAIGAIIAFIIFSKFYDLSEEKVKMMIEANVKSAKA